MHTLGIVSAPSAANTGANLHTLRTFAEKAKEQGCCALCFPECFLTGYFPKEAPALAISSDSDVLKQVSAIASELQMDLLAGFMESETADKNEPVRLYITHGLFAADGSLSLYRKTHLGAREQEIFTAGNSLDVFRLTCGLQIGIQLCVETHYPDITQTLSLRGARVVFAPHAVPRVSGSRKTIWEKYIPARSYDNRVYMACCNQCDEDRFGGGLLVTAPNGEILADGYEEHPQLLVFQVPKQIPAPKYYFPAKKRTELYL